MEKAEEKKRVKEGNEKRWYRDRESGREREDRREKEEEARGRNEERWKKGGRVGRRTGKGIKQAGERGTAGRFLLPSLSAAFELSLQRGTWQNDSQKTMFAFLHHTPYTSPTFWGKGKLRLDSLYIPCHSGKPFPGACGLIPRISSHAVLPIISSCTGPSLVYLELGSGALLWNQALLLPNHQQQQQQNNTHAHIHTSHYYSGVHIQETKALCP